MNTYLKGNECCLYERNTCTFIFYKRMPSPFEMNTTVKFMKIENPIAIHDPFILGKYCRCYIMSFLSKIWMGDDCRLLLHS